MKIKKQNHEQDNIKFNALKEVPSLFSSGYY